MDKLGAMEAFVRVVKAGNFSRWDDAKEAIRNDDLIARLTTALEKSDHYGQFRVCITMPYPIGWLSTVPEGMHLTTEDVEPFKLNGKQIALRVRKERADILAPQTRMITLVGQLIQRGNTSVCLIYTMYPGRDIGSLRSLHNFDSTHIFFDWSHPGSPEET